MNSVRLAIVATMVVLLTLTGSAQATLVPAELRAGDDVATAQLAPLFDPAAADETSLAVRPLVGPTLGVPGSDESVIDCPIRAQVGNYGKPYLTSNPPVIGENLHLIIEPCRLAFPRFPFNNYGRIEVFGSGPENLFRMRHETFRSRGSRDGVIEPMPDQRFTLQLQYYHSDTDVLQGICSYEFQSPARIDVYNKGHGHKIDFEREALTFTGSTKPPPHPCIEGTAWFSLEIRLRAWDPKPGFPVPWTLPVWLLPAQPAS